MSEQSKESRHQIEQIRHTRDAFFCVAGIICSFVPTTQLGAAPVWDPRCSHQSTTIDIATMQRDHLRLLDEVVDEWAG